MSYKLANLTCSAFIALALLLLPTVTKANSDRAIAQSNYLELNNLLLKGKQYVEKQNYDRALKTYEQAASLDRHNSQIFSGIGYVQTQRAEYDAAAKAYQQAIALSPNDPKLYYALGFCLGNAGENPEAAVAYRKAIELEPDNIQNHLGLGVILLREKEYDRAVETYNHILAIAPDNEQAYNVIARILIEQDKSAQAISLVQKAIGQYPQLADLQIQLATVLSKNDPKSALKALNAAKQNDPYNHLIYLRTGDVLYQQQKFDAALIEYQQASRLKLNSAEAIEGIGKVYLAKHNYFRSTSEFRRLTRISVDNPSGYRYLGISLRARKRYDEAIAAFNQALKLYQSAGNTQEADKVVAFIDELNSKLNPN